MEMPGIYSICIPGSHTRKGADRVILRKNPDDAILRKISPIFQGNIDISGEIGLRLACSLDIQLTTLQAASHSRYHVHQDTPEGPEDRSTRR